MRKLWPFGCALLLLCGCPTTNSAGKKLSALDEAHIALDRNEPEKAIPLIDDLLKQSPSDLDLARLRSEAYVKAGRGDELLQKTQADTAVDHYQRGLVLFARAKDSGRAISEFQRAVELSPDNAELHHRLGVALLETEQFDKALPPLKRASELAPDRKNYLLPLAKALYRNNQRDAAVDALRQVVLSNPNPAEITVARQLMNQINDPFEGFPKSAQPKLEQGMKWLNELDVPQQAIIAFEEILHDYPDLAVVHGLLGLAYQRIDDAGRAVDEFKRSIELDPKQGQAHYYLGALYQSRQRPENARDEYEKATQLDPFIDDAWARLGDLAIDRGDAPAAEKLFRVLCALKPDDVLPRSKLALTLQMQGDFAAAENELNQVLAKDPDNVDLQLRMGLLYVDKKRQSSKPEERDKAAAEAEKWLHKVLDEQPDNSIASQALEALHAP